MNRLIRPACTGVVAALALTALAPEASAQIAAFNRLFRPYHQAILAELPDVAKELKLTDEQKTKVTDIVDTFYEDRGALWQEAQGDFESIQEDMAILVSDVAKQVRDALDEAQNKRLVEIYVQTNGPTALFDDSVAASLKLTDEQKDKLQQVRNEQRQAWFSSGVDWQSLGEDEAEKEVDKLIAAQDEAYGAIMTDEQKTELEKLKGEKFEIDLSALPSPFQR